MLNRLCQKSLSFIVLQTLEDEYIVCDSELQETAQRVLKFLNRLNIDFSDTNIISDMRQAEGINLRKSGLSNILQFCTTAPLTTDDGVNLGTLFLIDNLPDTLSDLQRQLLQFISRQIVLSVETKLNAISLQNQLEEIEGKNKSLRRIAQIQSHDIRQPLCSLMSLIHLVSYNKNEFSEEWLTLLHESAQALDQKIKDIVKESMSEKDIKAIRFNKMVEEIEDYAILLLDKDGRVENWNKGAEKIKGYKPGEIIGKHFSVFYTQGEQVTGKPNSLLLEAKSKGYAKDKGWRVRKDGGVFWASVLITAIHDDNGEVIGYTKVTRDLKLKRTEKLS